MTDHTVHSHPRATYNGRSPELGAPRPDIGRLAADTVPTHDDHPTVAPLPLDRANITRKRSRKGGTSATVTGVLMADARQRLALDRDADAILLADALGLYERGAAVPVLVAADRVDSLGRKRAARIGDVPDAPFTDRWEIDAESYAAATQSLAADGMTVGIPFRESFAQVVGIAPVSRRAWRKLSDAEVAERDQELATSCPVARHTADLDPFTASAFDRDLLSATRERTAVESKLPWRGHDGFKQPRLPRGIKRNTVAAVDGSTSAIVGASHPDGRVWIGHTLTRPKVSARTVQERRWRSLDEVRSRVLEACAAVLADREPRTVDVNGVAVAIAAATKRGTAPTAATKQLYVAYSLDGTTRTATTPAGAARAILSKVAAA